MLRKWLADGTLVFTRELWQRNPDTRLAIDTRFLWTPQHKRLLTLEREDIFVGIIHPANTSHKDTRYSVWRPIPFKELDDVVRRFLAVDMLETTAIMGSR